MDHAGPHAAAEDVGSDEEVVKKPRQLPDDLPKSLDDRRSFPSYGAETEMYDAWQGQSQFLTTPIPAKPLAFNLALDEPSYDDEITTSKIEDSDSRLMEMLAAQAAHRDDGTAAEDEDAVVDDDKLSKEEKADALQKSLNRAASNGDVETIRRLVNGSAKEYVDVNKPDEDGTVPLIYASCFGHQEVVAALLDAGALVDKQDRNNWSPLFWATTNRHKQIAKMLLDHGASQDIRSTSGGTAFDFIQPDSDFSRYLQENGYHVGNSAVADDFYDTGFAQDRFEEEMAENELKRRMLMKESAANLEVDLSTLGFDEQPESPTDAEEEEAEFVWDRCIGDQMFVFQDEQLGKILEAIITNMTPQRSPSQKPIPANLLFLMARYAFYHNTPALLETLLGNATAMINQVVERHQWDMTMLAFWISNATLLLHYLKKDAGLVEATSEFQQDLAELINEIFILIIRDAERRMNRVLDTAMLDHETIPGMEDIHFQGEWNLFSRSKAKTPEPLEKRFRPPSPKRRAQPSPRNITSLLSSTLFVLDLYDVHSVIIAQIIAQLFYWLNAELFNRIMTTKRYLSRTKAMQIRMNISVLEDWARSNNRQPEHYENGSTVSNGENTVDASRRHLAPIVQLLQWLQCFSSLGEDFEALVNTLQQLPRLTPTQLIHTVKNYRQEVGEKSLPKSAMKYLQNLQKSQGSLVRTQDRSSSASNPPSAPVTPAKGNNAATSPTDANGNGNAANATSSSPPSTPVQPEQEQEDPRTLLLNPALMLPFSLPTSTDMLISYGAGIGGTNRERARKYIPTVPTEIIGKLELNGPESREGSVSEKFKDLEL